jgi:hypothetical protein
LRYTNPLMPESGSLSAVDFRDESGLARFCIDSTMLVIANTASIVKRPTPWLRELTAFAEEF